MKRVNRFIKVATIGGFLVLLPAVLLFNMFDWLVTLILKELVPLTELVVVYTQLPAVYAQWIAALLVLATCFVIGVIASNNVGKRLLTGLEHNTLGKLPGYNVLKEIVGYFAGNKREGFSNPVLVRLTDSESYLAGFLMGTYPEANMVSVFVPTSPNPTTGFAIHLEKDRVVELDLPAAQVFRNIVACGANSDALIASLKSSRKVSS